MYVYLTTLTWYYFYMKLFKKQLQEERPVFIFGTGRSGTTLVQRIINTNADFAISGEHGGFLKGLAESYFYKDAPPFSGYLNNSDVYFIEKSEYLKNIKNPEKWTAWTNFFNEDIFVTQYRKFLYDIFARVGVKRWGFKDILYGNDDQVLEFLLDIFPKLKCIIVVRNPLDVILSRIESFGHNRDNHEEMADRWVAQNMKYIALLKKYPDSFMYCRYETLLQDKNISGVEDFLATKKPFDYESVLKVKIVNSAEKRIDRDAVFTEHENKRIKEITASVANYFNYF